MSLRPCAVLAIIAAAPALLHAQVPAGEEFIVTTAGNTPAVAADAAGNFVVAFMSDTYPARTNVMARRFDASGAPLGAEFQVNTYTTGCQGNVFAIDAASHPSGDFIVVWTSFGCFDGPSQDGSEGGIYAQRYDRYGLPRGAEFRVNSYTTGHQDQPSVAVDGAGNAVVVWTSLGQVEGRSLFGQRYGASGQPLGGEFQVNADTTYGGLRPTVRANASGSFVVVWDKEWYPDGVVARRFAASGTPLGVEFSVEDPQGPRGQIASVALDPQGGFVVSWAQGAESGYARVQARRFDPAGTPLGMEIEVGTSPSGRPALAMDPEGSYVVAWPQRIDPSPCGYVMGRRFAASGAPRGAEFRVSATACRESAAIATDESGNFVVASDVGFTVLAQRFGGVVPAPAQLDAVPSSGGNGNGVLEAGESVEFVPAWRNVNGAAQTFDGQALAVSGPTAPGVSYVLHDAVGAYGTVPNGSTIPCSDCYEVGVTSEGPRPSLHWDARLMERLTPDALGQTRVWPLHIGDSFSDVPRTSPYYRAVETILHGGVTSGCRAAEYCPRDAVTREQMAVLTLVGRHGSSFRPAPCSAPIFGDVPAASLYCRFIEELSRRGVTAGCGDGNFCPAEAVTREQMAVFVLKTLDPALDPPACSPPNIFSDVAEGSPFCRWIEELARRGVVAGCGGGRYCASSPTTREEMAVVVAEAYGLKLY